MNKQELVKRLIKLDKYADADFFSTNHGDAEDWHIEADDLLLEYINDKDIKDAYDNISKWYA